MGLADDIKSDLDQVFLDTTEFAETVTYQVAATGATSSIRVVPVEQVGSVDPYGDTLFTVSQAEVAAPENGDILTWRGRPWVVVRVREAAGGYSWELRCRAPEEVV